MQGQIIYNENLGMQTAGKISHEIELNNISKGTYIVRLEYDKEYHKSIFIKK